MTEPTHSDTESTVTLLLLGDDGCGKSLFLSRLKDARLRLRQQSNTTQLEENNPEPQVLRDSDQPFIYDIRFSKKSFQLEVYDTSCPNQHWSTLKPDVVVIAFDISNRETLAGLKGWRNNVTEYFQHGSGERIPVMLLGLKRDLREEGEGIIYPQETYRLAQEMRCDRYAECSALTGELLAETFEDIARLAGMSKTEKGAQSAEACNIL